MYDWIMWLFLDLKQMDRAGLVDLHKNQFHLHSRNSQDDYVIIIMIMASRGLPAEDGKQRMVSRKRAHEAYMLRCM